MVQIIRYKESPVGPYDEFVLVPGKFEYESNDRDDEGKGVKKSNLKVSRIYVSQEKTSYNGRKSKQYILLSRFWISPGCNICITLNL